ncbi:MAG TPA: alpha-2-macroglobulin family protein, partial [Opitutaceae bacterium]|nr:alpha-2-macroglobulin family protein [Opitutaceae bacterium]
AFVELVSQGRVLHSRWTATDRTQERIELPVTEVMRGGVSLRVTYVRENRAYLTQRTVEVPWTNKKLTVAWEKFRSKLEPGQKETWTAVVTGPDATQAVAEMVATLYDASLDQFQTHRWPDGFHVFRHESDPVRLMFENTQLSFRHLRGQWAAHPETPAWNHRDFPAMLIGTGRGYGPARVARMGMAPGGMAEMAEGTVALSAFSVAASPEAGLADKAGGMRLGKESNAEDLAQRGDTNVDLSRITARKNLQETAFFFPQLLSDRDGRVRLQFTMPEALTEWKFLGFAHDQDLRSGFLTDRVVTAKDIMVEPNPPRFLREGDTVEFTVKVSNQTDQPQAGQVKLSFADAVTQSSVDAALGLGRGEQPFNVPAKQSRTVSWRIKVPDGLGVLTYKAVGGTARASDGEEGYLPVLSRRILVSESLPLPVRGRTTKEFEFTKLLASAGSTTLRHQALTVQMVSQPAWYAVMALPSLMEYPYDCSEQVFNRLYATALARHIAGSDPKIRRIFDLWQGTAALDSPLEKNPELKSVLLEESPWLRQARSESEARRRVGLLFDRNRLDQETARQLTVLAERQLEEGLWPWFPGGPPSEYISLYIMTGFGRLRHLGIDVDATVAVKALQALDAWMHQRYLANDRRDAYVPGPTDALYLYGRSFYLKDVAIAPAHREAVDYLRAQAARTWTKVDGRQSLAHLALALHRWGDTTTPAAILASLKERSVTDPELGRFWRDSEEAWWWHRAPIETQAMMIEAFAEITRDTQAVDDCQVWLLKQKQTQAWKTTKATADAVYGLLLRGKSLLSSDALVEVSLGGTPIRPENVEPGTGYYEKTLVRDEIRPAMGRVSVRKKDEGVSWGSVHWSYLEDVSKVTPHEGTPLRLKKTLFVVETTSQGRVLKPVTGALAVGDELVVRLELRTDRDMEYVHLKDQRGSGTEPVAVLSRYRYQDGLAYYESTRDTASHFFIDYLRKGTYVFEYSTRVQLKGRYQSGLAEIQCMYAPEFNSHSQSFVLEVK